MKYILLIILALTVDIYSQGIIGTSKTHFREYITTEPTYYNQYNGIEIVVKGDTIKVDSVIFDTSGDLWCKVSAKGYRGYFKLSNLEFDSKTQIKVDSISKVRADEYKEWVVKINEQRRILKQEKLVKEQKELKEKEKQLKERKNVLNKKYGKK